MSFLLIHNLKVCRVCLAMDVKMHSLLNDFLKTSFESITDIPVMTMEQLPMFLCFECAGLVQKYSLFKQRCLKGQTILLDFLQNGVDLSQQVIQNIDRKEALLKSSFVTTTVETVEYNPLNDNSTETQAIQNLVKEEPEISLDIIEHEILEDVPSIDDSSDSSDDELLTNKVKKEKLIQTGEAEQEFLNTILFEDSIDNSIKSESEPLTKSASMCEKGQSQKSVVVKKRNVKRSAKTTTSSLRTSAKSPETKSTSSRTNAKSPRTNAKSPSASAKPTRTANAGIINNSDDDVDLVGYETIDLTLEQQLQEIEKRKKSENYMHSPFKCEVCYRGFKTTDTYNNHVNRHDPSAGDFECEICKFRFPTRRKLKNHSFKHEKIYPCKGCSNVSTNANQARSHQKWHKGMMYVCDKCGKVSKRQNTHLTHIRTMHPSPYVCDICGYSFVSELGVVQHKSLTHKDAEGDHDSGRYCAECDVKFLSLEAYNRHMVTSNKHSGSFDGSCQTCGARFPSRDELRAHRTQQHPEQRNLYRKKYYYGNKSSRSWPAQCEHCMEEIPNAREYWTHFRRAHPDLPYPIPRDYVCDICGKAFRGNAYLKYHKRTHSSERLFKCSCCSKSFYNRWNLDAHVVTHSEARPHACKLCPQTFRTRTNLIRHSQIHTGVKPYKCEICGKAFNQSNSRKVHIRTVHLKEPAPYISKVRLEKKKKTVKEVN